MKILLLLSLLCAGCATTAYVHVRDERTGPVVAETWRNRKTGQCERRVYLDSMYFKTIVPCPEDR